MFAGLPPTISVISATLGPPSLLTSSTGPSVTDEHNLSVSANFFDAFMHEVVLFAVCIRALLITQLLVRKIMQDKYRLHNKFEYRLIIFSGLYAVFLEDSDRELSVICMFGGNEVHY